MIHKTTSVNVGCEWPSNSVLHVSFLELWMSLRNLPDFFKSKTVVLNTYTIFSKIVMRLKPFGKTSTSSLREDSLLCFDYDTRFECVLVAAVLSNT